jgi:polysaccharide biosynthesis/export protein
MKALPWLILIVLMAFASAGCQRSRQDRTTFDPYRNADGTSTMAITTFTNQLSPEWVRPPVEPFRLGPGDTFDIEILGDEASPTPVTVGPDGRIYFHLLPGQMVWGLTLEEVRARLESGLRQYLREPRLALTLRRVESQRVWVMGRLNTPGIYPLQGPMTLIEAISRAGGLHTSRFTGTTEELADLHHSFLVREGKFLPVNFNRLIREGDTSQNVYLRPDDFIYLPSALSKEVYVLGAVGQPRAVGFKDQLTLVSAVTAARGTIKDAYVRQIAIVRGSLTEPSIAVVDYQAIVTGRQSDVPLQPRDIVYVPFTPYRSIARYLDQILNTFVRTVASNEGGRAIDPDFRPPGVIIPLGQ